MALARTLARIKKAAARSSRRDAQPRLLSVRFAVELRLGARRLAAELGFAAGLAVPGELRSFCSCSRSRRTALFIFSRSRRASRKSLATSLRRSFLPVRMLPRIAPSSFSVASSAVLIRAIARPFCSKRARAAAVTRGRVAGFLAVALRVDTALGAAVFRALALLTGGIDAPLSWNCSTLCHRGSHSSRPQCLEQRGHWRLRDRGDGSTEVGRRRGLAAGLPLAGERVDEPLVVPAYAVPHPTRPRLRSA